MNIIQAIKEALGSLTSNKLRSALTILGIVIGVAAVVAMMAIGQGAQNSITSSINGIGTNLLYVQSGNFTERVTNAKPLTVQDVTALQNPEAAPDIAAVAPVVQARLTVTANGQTTNVQISGVTPQNEAMTNDSVSEGQYIDQNQYTGRSAVAVIGPTTAQTLFSSTTGIVGQSIRVNSQPFQIIGVLTSKGGSGLGNQDDRILIPLTT
ncbi:MAG: ABC transporter permease, partial [Anaerolineaceae bacterium]|nr:ABC transporter permease [Anaerolineaceae bacterium]